MADRASASIFIGGRLHHRLVDALAAAIDADRLCVDYDDRRLSEDDIVSGFPLYGAANDVAGACFDETEAFCQEHGLSYVRRSDACLGAWDANMSVCRPDGSLHQYGADASGTVMLTIDEIRALGTLDAIEAHCAPALADVGALWIVGDEDPRAPHPA
jgi:hypothetical protein